MKKKEGIMASFFCSEECQLAFKLDSAALKEKKFGRSYDAVSWSRASADESLHYYGLSSFLAILYFVDPNYAWSSWHQQLVAGQYHTCLAM